MTRTRTARLLLLPAAAAALLRVARPVRGAPPPGLVDWASPARGSSAVSSSDAPLCWGPPVGTYSDGLARYCTSVGAAFDGNDVTFWAEPGGDDAGMPHPSRASPSWMRVALGAPARLRGARLLLGTSANYTLEVSVAGPDGPWTVVAEHVCDEDLGCTLGFDATYCGGYDPTPGARRREVTHAFDTGALAPATHARWRNTWASLGGFACGDVCLWSNLLFELELWGDPPDAAGTTRAAAPARQVLGTALALGSAAAAAARLGGRASG